MTISANMCEYVSIVTHETQRRHFSAFCLCGVFLLFLYRTPMDLVPYRYRRRQKRRYVSRKLQVPGAAPPPVPANHSSPLCFGGSDRLVWDVIWPRADSRLLPSSVAGHSRFVRHTWRNCPRTEWTCQREARPPGAGRSRQSGASPSTTPRTCPRITPRPREGPCSARPQEVTNESWRRSFWGGFTQSLNDLFGNSKHWRGVKGQNRRWAFRSQLNVDLEPVLKGAFNTF